MNQNNSLIAVLLEIINPGLGYIYYKKVASGNIVLSIFSLIVTILLISFIPSETQFWYHTEAFLSGMFSMSRNSSNTTSCAIIFWCFVIGFTRTFSLFVIYDDIKSRSKTLTNQFTSDKLIKELTKIHLLLKENIIDEVEYKRKVGLIILNLKNFGIPENKEDFLIKIIPLKDSGIITQNILHLLKNSIL